MTVAELIAELQKMPQDLPVAVFAADEHLIEASEVKVDPDAEIPFGYWEYKTIKSVCIR